MKLLLFFLTLNIIHKISNEQDPVCYKKSVIYHKKNVTKIVDVSVGSSIKLECHYCDESDDYEAKIWNFRKRDNKTVKVELISNIYYELNDSKIYISPSHTLHLKEFGMNNSGIYACSYFGRKEDVFTYVLDAVYDDKVAQRIGTKRDWYEFRRNVIEPSNYLIMNKNSSVIFPFEIMFSWREWGICKSSGHENERQKTGKCRIRPLRRKNLQMISSRQTSVNGKLTTYLLDGYSMSCRSMELSLFYPEISRVIRNVPEFIIKEPCTLTKQGTKTKKHDSKNTFKYNVTRHVAENGHLILTCPEVIANSEVNWFKDNCLLNSSFRNNMAQSLMEPHVTIDAYNVLYILQAAKSDEGTYTCTVDGRNMQIFNVKVVSKYKLLNQDFIRYSIYLGFVLLLTVTCYCAGVCVAWQRRASFADPLNLMKKKYSYVSHRSDTSDLKYISALEENHHLEETPQETNDVELELLTTERANY